MADPIDAVIARVKSAARDAMRPRLEDLLALCTTAEEAERLRGQRDWAQRRINELQEALEARSGLDYEIARRHESPPNEVTLASALGQRDRALAELAQLRAKREGA